MSLRYLNNALVLQTLGNQYYHFCFNAAQGFTITVGEGWESFTLKLSEGTADRHLLLVERHHPSKIISGVC